MEIPLDATIVGCGLLLVSGMFAFMLRRPSQLVALEPEHLLVGPKAIPWAAVQGLVYARGSRGAFFRVATPEGIVAFRDDELPDHPDHVRSAIVARAELSVRPVERPPRDLPLLPGDSYEEWGRGPAEAPQATAVSSSGDLPPLHPQRKAVVGAGVLLALLLKFGKFALLGVQWLAKGLKLGKLLPTAASMLVAVWAYAQLWGWRFAAGFVVLILLHELGHAAVIRAKGLRTSPIVFVPFVGAFIGIKDQFRDARVEAEMAYGGPAAGAAAASACWVVSQSTGHPFWLHLAYVGFLMNLFNLLPVSPLDGGRVVGAISVWLWVPGLALAAAVGFALGSPILLVIVFFGALRAWRAWKERHALHVARYFDLPGGYRLLMACAYFGLCAYLGYMTHRTLQLAGPTA